PGDDASVGGARTGCSPADEPALGVSRRCGPATGVDAGALREISLVRRRAIDEGAGEIGEPAHAGRAREAAETGSAPDPEPWRRVPWWKGPSLSAGRCIRSAAGRAVSRWRL